MNNQERQQQRMIVGWWLDVPPAELVGDPATTDHLRDITDLFNNIVMDDGIEKLAPKANDYELKKRISRVEKALSGVSMQAIAKEEFVSTGAVSSMVKDTLARLAVATREQNDE